MSTAPEQATKPNGDWSQLLLNKVVIVTGAGGSIGSVIAQTCASHGARVVIADINKKAKHGKTPLFWAMHPHSSSEVVKYLLMRGAD